MMCRSGGGKGRGKADEGLVCFWSWEKRKEKPTVSSPSRGANDQERGKKEKPRLQTPLKNVVPWRLEGKEEPPGDRG